jgi:hypothetical protein
MGLFVCEFSNVFNRPGKTKMHFPHEERKNERKQGSPASLSLLWPPGKDYEREANLTQAASHDLDLAYLVRAFELDRDRQEMILDVLRALIQDPDVIQYRQEVLADLISFPELAAHFESLLSKTEVLGKFSFESPEKMNALSEVAWRLGELQSIVDSVRVLAQVFEEVGERLQSQGLCDLRNKVLAIQEDPDFQALAEDLSKMLSQLRTCASVTIGVNLDQFLRPVEATLLSSPRHHSSAS